MAIFARVTHEPILLAEAVSHVQCAAHGAIDVFIGTVRNTHNEKEVTGITYDTNTVLAETVFRDICKESETLWPDTHYAVIHATGALPVGGTSIVIAVSAPHRDESFKACRHVIEKIKERAPIWKQEHYVDGKSEWLPGHSLRRKSHA